MKKIFAIFIAVCIVSMLPPLVGADLTQNIVVTLNPQGTMSILVNESTWEPSCALSGNESTANNWAKITNNGNIPIGNVTVHASNTSTWTLASSPGHNLFNISIIQDGKSPKLLTISPSSWIQDFAVNATEEFGLHVYMPTSSSTTQSQTTTITFTATAG